MSNDKLIRCITSDGAAMITAAVTSDTVWKAQHIHRTSPVATAALGRLLTAASLMGAQLKADNASITLRISTEGSPAGAVIAVGDSSGNVRGYVQNPGCPTTYYPNGKLNVAQAVGSTGVLNVMRDLGSGEPYMGMVPLVSGEIAEDITSYYATSEGMSIMEICEKALDGFEVEKLDESDIGYVCNCSREKVERAFLVMSDDDIRASAEDLGHAEASCHFCNKIYRFSKDELEEIISHRKKEAE